jgi:hypothetical protein
MRPLVFTWWACMVLAGSLLLFRYGICDRIILKDGSVEQSHTVWESEHYIHFILKGTRDVEVRYAKGIVERIEGLKPTGYSGTPELSGQSFAPPVRTQGEAVQAPSRDSLEQRGETDKIVAVNRGISFYDPRRPMRYWADRESKHKNLQAAVAAIARFYGRSTQWVTVHMGDHNDLGTIHFNLIKQARGEKSIHGEKVTGGPSIIVGSRIAADEGMTEEDDPEGLSTIPQSAVPTVQSTIEEGIRFYDPRRSEKYWSGQMTRHNSLKEAIETLARQYGVSPEWIENHMGETNELSQIHHNIRRSLKSP